MKFFVVLVILWSCIAMGQVEDANISEIISAPITYDLIVEIFEKRRCANCHAELRSEVPSVKFLKNMAFRFDLKNNGRHQKPGPRMQGAKLKGPEPIIVKEWILQGALDIDGNVTLTEEEIDRILGNQ